MVTVGHRARQWHRDGTVRVARPNLEFALLNKFAIYVQAPHRSQRRKIAKRLTVRNGDHVLALRHRDGDGAIHPRNFAHRRMRNHVGRDEPIGHEVAVVGRVAKQAAIGKALGAIGQGLSEPVVFPFPQEAALQTWRGGDGIPVIGQ